MKNTVVVGAGYWGKNLIRNHYNLNALYGVCDKSAERLNLQKKNFPDVYYTSSFQDILAIDNVEQVVIATPTATHYELAKQALLANKHVYIEKAMCQSSEQAWELTQLAEEKKRVLMVGHLMHYHPVIQKIKEILISGQLGELKYLEFNRCNFGSKSIEESALWSFAPHDVSLLLAMVDVTSPFKLKSFENYISNKSYADGHQAYFEFYQGTKALINISWLHPRPRREIIIVGSKASLVFDDTSPWDEKLFIVENTIELKGSFLSFEQGHKDYVQVDEIEPLREECQHFINCCQQGKQPKTCGLEGTKVIKVLEEIQQSAKSHTERILDLSHYETLNTREENLKCAY